ncbi:hypothetical protein BDP55DRAFT_633356 [Colletotrichum godetiae]|uniref:Uncharacterized protein n=1 Tax=Colletotrichum godetiae TaxID=1209918 RepID=A0AAJ0AHU6_9PEZI|nr:uncharacterized protein BDP55DRAFT_633356 [Colletotrichum godetiae]KAK1674156.1 hypothetical protein BDP55DRAFT_633356 [Colletotrichum godetiae]
MSQPSQKQESAGKDIEQGGEQPRTDSQRIEDRYVYFNQHRYQGVLREVCQQRCLIRFEMLEADLKQNELTVEKLEGSLTHFKDLFELTDSLCTASNKLFQVCCESVMKAVSEKAKVVPIAPIEAALNAYIPINDDTFRRSLELGFETPESPRKGDAHLWNEWEKLERQTQQILDGYQKHKDNVLLEEN